MGELEMGMSVRVSLSLGCPSTRRNARARSHTACGALQTARTAPAGVRLLSCTCDQMRQTVISQCPAKLLSAKIDILAYTAGCGG